MSDISITGQIDSDQLVQAIQSATPVTEPVIWEYHVAKREIDEPIDQATKQMDKLGDLGWELTAVSQYRLFFKRPKQATPNPAVKAILTVNTQGDKMPGQITVDTTNETVTVAFVDDKGDTNATAPVAASGAALAVTFTSDNEAVCTVATDSTNPLQGDVTVVAEGTANLGASLAYADGTPVLEADGVTPFPEPATVAVTVSAGAAVGDSLTLSV